MTVLRLVLGDQLTRGVAALRDLDPTRDVVLMAEVAAETTYVRHHKQKIALVLAAMRHFADALTDEGVRVDYVRLDDPGNTGSLSGEVARAVARHRPGRLVVTGPGEWRVQALMDDWREELDLTVEIREDDRFLISRDAFARFAETERAARRPLRMEAFYRLMRRRTGLLMEDGNPRGGRWNFDRDNRRRLPASHRVPARARPAPDATTRAVLDLVAARFPDHFGDLDGFAWPVTRADALAALEDFVADHLPAFGDFQDAMRGAEPFVHHALLAPALNLGLLLPDEVCAAAEAAHRAGRAPLNAVEGFVRQVIGWREYVRGIYWTFMPDYAASNALEAHRDLPWFYWSGETAMNCVSQCVGDTRRHAYAHHIQRLMVLGNFALLSGVEPAQLQEWFLVVYADAFEWVELPNVHGMALFADGGLMGSKPYAASGAYIDRMSDYCRGCAYDPRVVEGARACPFTLLYWDFLDRNGPVLRREPRLAMPYRALDAMAPARRRALAHGAARVLADLDRDASQRRPADEGEVATVAAGRRLAEVPGRDPEGQAPELHPGGVQAEARLRVAGQVPVLGGFGPEIDAEQAPAPGDAAPEVAAGRAGDGGEGQQGLLGRPRPDLAVQAPAEARAGLAQGEAAADVLVGEFRPGHRRDHAPGKTPLPAADRVGEDRVAHHERGAQPRPGRRGAVALEAGAVAGASHHEGAVRVGGAEDVLRAEAGEAGAAGLDAAEQDGSDLFADHFADLFADFLPARLGVVGAGGEGARAGEQCQRRPDDPHRPHPRQKRLAPRVSSRRVT